MHDAGGLSDMFAVAGQNWAWLTTAMALGFLVGWATYRRSGAD